MAGWVAQSPIFGTTITVERLSKRGYESLFSYYEKYLRNLMNRPDSSGWCERRSSLAPVSEAVYSIIACALLPSIVKCMVNVLL
jgi:hypothetical protein